VTELGRLGGFDVTTLESYKQDSDRIDGKATTKTRRAENAHEEEDPVG